MTTDISATVAADELRQFIERHEQLDSEEKDIKDQKKDLMAEAKGRGFDTKIMKRIIAERKKSPEQRSEEAAILDLYLEALGMGFAA